MGCIYDSRHSVSKMLYSQDRKFYHASPLLFSSSIQLLAQLSTCHLHHVCHYDIALVMVWRQRHGAPSGPGEPTRSPPRRQCQTPRRWRSRRAHGGREHWSRERRCQLRSWPAPYGRRCPTGPSAACISRAAAPPQPRTGSACRAPCSRARRRSRATFISSNGLSCQSGSFWAFVCLGHLYREPGCKNGHQKIKKINKIEK